MRQKGKNERPEARVCCSKPRLFCRFGRFLFRTGSSASSRGIGVFLLPLVWFGVSTFASAQQLPELKYRPEPPEQPIPFSHRLHVSQGLKCLDCHPVPDPGDFAEIVTTEKCMSCHSTIKRDSPAIQKVAEYHKKGELIPWEPVYLIPLYVFFSHRVHIEKAGAECQDCHGPVGERDVLGKERDISMAACMDCHRATGGSLECNYCHDPR